MFHYVFLDPATIDDAAQAGEMGLGRLVELLQGFRRDVLLAETDAWRVETEIGERVRAIPNIHQHERKLIGDLLIWMRRNSPLLLVEGDDAPDVTLADFARAKAEEWEIDLILSPGEPEIIGGKVIKSGLAKAHDTELSLSRTQLSGGLTFAQGSKNFEQVATECFRKLVLHADAIRIYDYALGKYYNNDQPVNLKKLVRFLRDQAPKLTTLELVTLPDGRISLDRDIADLRHEVNFTIQVDYRARECDMPHPRYFGANSRYLDIDRGIDLCDAHDRCRMTQIKYAASPE
jgi:hypothetical protein